MGALHAGHEQLITAAGKSATTVMVSIFVNPLQFGPAEGFDAYPRTLEADLDRCRALGVDAVFAPSEQEMYPDGFAVTVSAGRMGTVLEGAARPGHFDGVLTVVLKLFTLTRPDLAFFGLKDIQQYALITRMVTDLNLNVGIRGVDVVRDADGLAQSSRNNFLSSPERGAALALTQALHAGAEVVAGGLSGPAATVGETAAIRTAAEQVLGDAAGRHPELDVDYLDLVDFDTFGRVSAGNELPSRSVLAVAAHVGTTRLIDNVRIGPGWQD